MIPGASLSFAPGAYDRVERAIDHMLQTRMTHAWLPICQSELSKAEHATWFDWLLPRLDRDLDVVPCLVLDETEANQIDAARTTTSFIAQFGEHFTHMSVQPGPGSSEALHAAAEAGKRVVLAAFGAEGSILLDNEDLVQMATAVAVDGQRASQPAMDTLRRRLEEKGREAEVWCVGVGHSLQDPLGPLAAWDSLQGRAARMYWCGIDRAASGVATANATMPALTVPSEDHRACGLWEGGRPAWFVRLLAAGRDPRELSWLLDERHMPPPEDHIVVTGGAGFVGTNLVDRLLRDGQRVLVVDSLDREGSLTNLEWLRTMHGNALRVHVADVRDEAAVAGTIRGARAVFHLAGQVAVTTSIEDPVLDFEVNARGTLNVLEAVRRHAPGAFVLFASTNKVYGSLDGVELVERPTRWEPRKNGTAKGASRSISFATPYGCSKGAADQYVLDYAQTFGIDATVFRMSCIYGPHQHGTADQGWLVHFLRSAAEGKPLTIYGDGKQVRDVLHVDDLVEAYLTAMRRSDTVRGRAWDVGGGTANTTSLVELMATMESIGCPPLDVSWQDARPSDQKHFVAEIGPLCKALDWQPRISVEEGVRRVWETLGGRKVLA